ncbi:FAD/NAD(P)-binding protein, partial [Zavarzinia sp.]|uniref:FAD/NAD(P)-binding protein n=1 Tax=Zavarzinia sp. TaxID=2027920 RepID=UPI003BB5DBA7
DDGDGLAADVVALTASHTAPAFRWPLSGEAAAHPGLIRDPWSSACLAEVAPDAGVFVVGTGLTMADTVVSLRRRGHRGQITAVSRRALLPREHGVFGADICFPEPFPTTAVETLRVLRHLIADCERRGLGWHPAIDAFRGALRRLWPGLSAEEQGRALRHLRAWWDVHRYRIAPQVAALLARGRRDGWLRVAAGRIEGFDTRDGDLVARWQPRGGPRRETRVAVVVNCTGPDADPARSVDPLFRGLLATGIARPDRHRLGLDIDPDGRVLERSGRPQPGFYIAGPLGRGRLGEVMGVPEASDHAREIAGRIAADLAIPLKPAS